VLLRRSFHRGAVRDVQVQIAEMKKGTPRAICPPERLATKSIDQTQTSAKENHREKHQ
jgi:hypothetical protein